MNNQLTDRFGSLVATTTTAPVYGLFALRGTVPPKPGLVRADAEQGAAIAVEVWHLSDAEFGRFVAGVPPPLCIGSVELADGSWHKDFLCEPRALAGARDISEYGGWRAYLGAC